MWVAPFGNPRIKGYLLLHAAYRSLSRPSSAPDAKAFPLRSFQLDLRQRGLPPQRSFTEIAILVNYAGFTKKFFEIVIVTLHPFGCCSTIKICLLPFGSKRLSVALLHFHHIVQFSRCRTPAPFEARSQNPISIRF